MNHKQLHVTDKTRKQVQEALTRRKSVNRDSRLRHDIATGRGPKSELPPCRER